MKSLLLANCWWERREEQWVLRWQQHPFLHPTDVIFSKPSIALNKIKQNFNWMVALCLHFWCFCTTHPFIEQIYFSRIEITFHFLCVYSSMAVPMSVSPQYRFHSQYALDLYSVIQILQVLSINKTLQNSATIWI